MLEISPTQCQTGLLKILAQKGDLSKPGNYQGTMLLEAICKLVAKIIHSHFQPIIESLDHESQYGFRSGRWSILSEARTQQRREHSKETFIP